MARFLLGTIPVIGHVNPSLPIVRKLVERGHEVWWYTGRGFQSKVTATGAHFVPIQTGIDFSVLQTIPESFIKERNSLKGLKQLKFTLKHALIDSAATQLQDFRNILQEFPADILLADSLFLGASWVHQQGGPPWAAFNTTALPFSSRDTAPFGLGIPPDASPLGRVRNHFLNWVQQKILFKDVIVYLDQVRASVGLSSEGKYFFDATLSPFLFLQPTVPLFEYPRSDLPASVHFIGSLLPDPPAVFNPPTWWAELKGSKPVVHVTQGTVATDADDLIVPTLQALADEDVLVVATTGGQPIESIKIDPIPGNVRIEPFIPHYHLLPHVDIMVTNGGYNGVQTALAFGVPLVTAGQTEEKPEVCARVQWAGVGINLRTGKPSSAQIRDAVKTILTSSHYRQKAQLLQAEIACYDAPMKAAILLEELVATKRPVLRTS